jgi:glycosyltransferase involved in cell wall biosynthesis
MSSEPLRIVHLVRAPNGGAFRHILDLASEQAAAGHAVGLVCDSLSCTPFDAAKIEAAEPQLKLGAVRLPIARQIAPSDVTALARVRSILAPLEPNVVHSHGAKGGVFGRLVGLSLSRGRRVRRFYSPHGGSLHYDPRSMEGRIYFAVERALERATDALFHVSAYEAATYRAKIGAPRCRAVVVRNGLRPEEFEPVKAAPDATDILYLGALRDLKGVDVLIEALAILKESGRPVTATIVGDGPDEERYRATVAASGLDELVRFQPPTPTRLALAQGRAIVVPSRAESMPYVVLEAIAGGLPIVATRVGGIPEIFGPFSDELAPAGDALALAEALWRMKADPAAAAASAAARKRHISGEFSLASMAVRVESVYREAVSGGIPEVS